MNEYQPIENYGVVGNLQTVALVGMHGSIDFLCFPYFDSPSVFAALLDRHKGGHFQIAPILDHSRQKQFYILDSNILLTRFSAEDGVAEISDFMPVSLARNDRCVEGTPTRLVRRVKTVRGEMRYRMVCAPRFDYARARHRVEQPSENEILFIAQGKDGLALRLHSPDVSLRHENGDAVIEFTLSAGKTVAFILEAVRPGEESPARARHFVSESFKETMNFWRTWIARSTYKGRWREMVDRSALTLKMLTSQRYGSIAAAATFGLPEAIGKGRNWDYRYTWIRDASFTLYGLNRLGFNDEAADFMSWIEKRYRESKPGDGLQLMYGLDGRHDLTEVTLDHLEGYRGSRPVRIGNGAFDQLQIDIYGELMDAVYLFNKFGRPIDYDAWQDITRLVDWVCKNYRQPDASIWEVRGEPREYLYSRLMSWVAIDRGIRLAQKRSFPTPPAHWFQTRDDIYRQIYTDFWDPRQKAFIQSIGSTSLDASSLMMPLVRFVSPTDRRWLSTLRGIEKQLVEDSLVYRYRANDGLDGQEGTFCMCSFWYVECLARSGDLEQARFLFEKMLGYANHLGLYAEELGPSGEHLGNFPQAFTHLGLISAAYNLNRLLDNPQALI